MIHFINNIATCKIALIDAFVPCWFCTVVSVYLPLNKSSLRSQEDLLEGPLDRQQLLAIWGNLSSEVAINIENSKRAKWMFTSPQMDGCGWVYDFSPLRSCDRFPIKLKLKLWKITHQRNRNEQNSNEQNSNEQTSQFTIRIYHLLANKIFKLFMFRIAWIFVYGCMISHMRRPTPLTILSVHWKTSWHHSRS